MRANKKPRIISGMSWLTRHYQQLRAVALVRHRRLRWVMEADDVLHAALLGWAPRQVPPEEGEPLSPQQIGTFSLTCRNVLINELRAFARRRKLAEGLAQSRPGSEESAERAAVDADLVQYLLSKLNQRDRQLLQKRYLEQLSYGEIAAQMGGTEAALRQENLRAIRALHVLCEEQGLL